MKTLFFITVVALSLSVTQLSAQKVERSVIATAGTYNSNATYKLSSTIGESAVMTLKAGGKILTQGFQQTTITVTTGIETEELARMNVSVFPNPTTEYLNIHIAENTIAPLSLSLSDAIGNTLFKTETLTSNERIDMGSYASGTYIVSLRNAQGGIIGTYTVLKVQ